MRRSGVLLATVSLIATASAQAQDRGFWKAVSNTARSITGDLSISEEKLTIAFSAFTIAQIRPLTAPEVSAAFDNADGDAGKGTLYRLNIPARKVFLHKNPLCGTEDTQWMATFVSGKTLQIAFFSGSRMPDFTPEALANSTALCGTYSYAR